jgi:hypothetical protein
MGANKGGRARKVDANVAQLVHALDLEEYMPRHPIL